jgi:hypothetical protein
MINKFVSHVVRSRVRADHICLLEVEQLRQFLLDLLLFYVALHEFNTVDLNIRGLYLTLSI